MSKELEALKTIGDLDYIDEYDCRDGSLKQHFNKEFKTIEKELKVLEVIKNRFIWVEDNTLFCGLKNNIEMPIDIDEEGITQEEFELLKEVLK